jgi:hypothetical protein
MADDAPAECLVNRPSMLNNFGSLVLFEASTSFVRPMKVGI